MAVGKTIKELVAEKFNGYDVSDLPAYIRDKNPEILQELQAKSMFMSKCNIMIGVKGAEKIKMMSSTVVLQSADVCAVTPDGGIIFTDKTVTNERLKVQETYCNEDLNSKWTREYNAIGANIQDMQNPFADVLIATKIIQVKNAQQDALILGDTTSSNPNLNKFDGLKKLWDADTNIPTVTAGANIYETFTKMARSSSPKLRANKIAFEVICDRVLMDEVIDYVWQNKDYNMLLPFDELEDGEISFVLPGTTVRFSSVAQLAETGDMYLVPFGYVTIAVDGDADVEGMSIDYRVEAQDLLLDVKFRLGTNYVYPEYFAKFLSTPA